MAAARARRLARLRSIGLLSAATLTLAACGSLAGKEAPSAGSGGSAAGVREPSECTTVLAGQTPEAVAAGVSSALFSSAPVVVIASVDDPAQVRSAAEKARQLGVPMLLDAPTPVSAGPAQSPSTASPTATTSGSSATTSPSDASSAAPSNTSGPTVASRSEPMRVPLSTNPVRPAPTPKPGPGSSSSSSSGAASLEEKFGPIISRLANDPARYPLLGTPVIPAGGPAAASATQFTSAGAACVPAQSIPATPGANVTTPAQSNSPTPTDQPTSPAASGSRSAAVPASATPFVNPDIPLSDEPATPQDNSCLLTSIKPAPAVDDTAQRATPTATPTPTASANSSAPVAGTPSPTVSASPTATTAPVAAPGDRAWAAEIRRLNPQVVYAADPVVAADVTTALPAVKVVTDAAKLPHTSAPKPLSGLTVFVPAFDRTVPTKVSPTPALDPNDPADSANVGAIASAASALAVGARVITLSVDDPRDGACSVEALSAHHPDKVLAVGHDFGSPSLVADRVATASTGEQIPGGGAMFFPGRRLVALYGHPDAPELGALGQQDLPDSITRAEQMAAQYKSLSDVPVVPTFEIIATTAVGNPTSDGTYSAKTPMDQLVSWVQQAGAAGMYVVLDLQPGLQNALTQAKMYEPLLKLPWVGLAVDPEWKLAPGQHPLGQIGSIGASELNDVSQWLSDLTAANHLPQKLFVIHQFRKSMILDEQDLVTTHDNLATLVHMDGQGIPYDKDATWKVVKDGLPPGVHWLGWKDFYVKDHPMITPEATMAKNPTPVMISYQ
jgi:hypothetical protein